MSRDKSHTDLLGSQPAAEQERKLLFGEDFCVPPGRPQPGVGFAGILNTNVTAAGGKLTEEEFAAAFKAAATAPMRSAAMIVSCSTIDRAAADVSAWRDRAWELYDEANRASWARDRVPRRRFIRRYRLERQVARLRAQALQLLRDAMALALTFGLEPR